MYHFVWSVPEKGYYWAGDSDDPYLEELPGSLREISYHPLEEYPELFFAFSQLSTPDDILRFANQYGVLVANQNHFGTQGIIKKKMRINDIPPLEYLSMWKNEIQSMRSLVEVWSWIKKGYKSKLGLRIIWDQNKVFFYYGPLNEKFTEEKAIKIADDKGYYTHIYSTWKKGSLIGPAELILQISLNNQLKMVSPRIIRDTSGNLHSYIMPHSLGDALWLQFYFAVTGIKKFVQCEICDEWMEITDINRKTKKAHDKCRKRDWAQKQRVFALCNSGNNAEDIVNETGFDKSRIMKWISEFQSKGGK